MFHEVSVVYDETQNTISITLTVPRDGKIFQITHITSLPFTDEKLSQFISRVKEFIDLHEKITSSLQQTTTQTPQTTQPTLPYIPPKPSMTFDTITTKLRELYPHVPTEILDRVVGKVADKCEIPRERFFKLSADEFEKLNNTLFQPVGEKGVREVLLMETIATGNYEIPTDQDERKLLLSRAREFVRHHPVLSRCEENVNQVRIDGWRGAFLALYEIYRLEENQPENK